MPDSLLEVVRADDADQASGAAAKAVVDSEQSTAENTRQGDIFGVVGSRPSEIVGDTPRLPIELPRRAALDGRRE